MRKRLDEGFYWVKEIRYQPWTIMRLYLDCWYRLGANSVDAQKYRPDVVGPRIEPPVDET
jgi:hypothetical protein